MRTSISVLLAAGALLLIVFVAKGLPQDSQTMNLSVETLIVGFEFFIVPLAILLALLIFIVRLLSR